MERCDRAKYETPFNEYVEAFTTAKDPSTVREVYDKWAPQFEQVNNLHNSRTQSISNADKCRSIPIKNLAL